jgi:hypothetical protein
VVRKFILDRRLAPFYQGYAEESDIPTDNAGIGLSPGTTSSATISSVRPQSTFDIPSTTQSSGVITRRTSRSNTTGSIPSNVPLSREYTLQELLKNPKECPICFLVSVWRVVLCSPWYS